MTSINTMPVTVSTVTPVYAGKEYLELLVAELLILKAKWEEEDAPIRLIECLFVDDGSNDGSSLLLAQLALKYCWVNVVSLSRNYGQHAATVAGLCHTSTDWVVTLDEDMQHKPSQIEELFRSQSDNKADVIYGRPSMSAHGDSWRDTASRFVKRVMAKLTSTPQIEMFNSFRLIRGSIARAAASSSSSRTYFDVSISWFTRSCFAVDLDLIDQRFVLNRESGYSFSTLVKHARRLIVSSELDIASKGLFIGGFSILIALVLGGISLVQRLFFPEAIGSAGWTSLVMALTFFSGVIIALLCVALEYLNIMVLNNLGRPTFFTIDRSNDELLKDWFCEV